MTFAKMCCLLGCLLFLSVFTKAQELDLSQPKVSSFDLSDGFSTICFEKTFQDPNGLLWLKSCPFVGWEYNHHFTTFDGHTPRIPKLKGDAFQNGTIVQALDITDEGIIYGIYSDEVRHENGLFFLNTLTSDLQILNSEALGSRQRPVVTCQADDEELILLFADLKGFEIRRFKPSDQSSTEVFKTSYDFDPGLRPANRLDPFAGRFVDASYIKYHQGVYRMLAGGLPFLEVDERTKTLKSIDAEELGPTYDQYLLNPEQPPILFHLENGNFGFVLPQTERGAWLYHANLDSFSPWPELFPMAKNNRAGISKSDSEQDLMVFRHMEEEHGTYQNFGLHPQGGVSKIIPKGNTREVFHALRSKSGNTILATDAGLHVIPNSNAAPASGVLAGTPMRGILPINNTEVLLNLSAIGKPLVKLKLDEPSSELKNISNEKVGNSAAQLQRRTDGKVWIPFPFKTALYDPQNDELKWFPHEFDNYERYDLIDDYTLVVFYEGSLYEWKPESNEKRQLYSSPELVKQTGYVHALRIDAQGNYNIAASDGLLQISQDLKSHQFYGEVAPYRFMKVLSITEHSNGDLWLGTFSDGVQIFDNETKTFESVQNADGLLSNTVATIEEDENGNMWAGTFNGVSCIKPETREVITTLTEDEGLANNESNRFSSTRFPDGRIAIGSISGFSIISPSSFIAEAKEYLPPEVFLSAAYWRDSESGERRNAFGSTNERITLPATERDLRLDLALSVYAKPKLHTFKYKIGDSDWQFAGSNHTIYLNGLQPGEYNIEVIGIDHQGNETANALIVPVSVLPFFYQQWWFYLLCALPFVLFAVAWIRRQRRAQKELELEVESATQQLRQDKVLIESQAEQLQQLDQLKSRFFTNISHEFRTPLAVIEGVSQRLLSEENEDLESSVGLIQKNAGLLLNLINQILDLVKLEAGQLKADYVQVNVVSFVKAITDNLAPIAELKGVTLKFSSQAEWLLMDVDQDKMVRILMNLLSNAIKFTDQGGAVEVQVFDNDGRLCLKVLDTGHGIPSKEIPFIFDRFYQVDSSSTREGEGTGIGLNFTKELIDLLGGSIDVESTEGEGSVFTVLLPITNEAEKKGIEELKIDQELALQVNTGKLELKGIEKANEEAPSLLIIEDNEDLTQLLVSIFAGKYRIETALNGQLGIERAKELVPDLILSDVMMPVKDGVTVLNELKNDSITSHIPILLLTAKADISSKIEGLSRGADDYISKPFHPEELELRVRNVLDARKKLQARYAQGKPEPISEDPELVQEDAFIGKLQDVLDANLDNSDFGIKDFCSELGVSRMQLHNKLKALTGLSTSHYIRSLRLQKAKQMMQKAELNISEIGYAVGFSSHAYFSKSFSEQFGMSPTEFRNQEV